MKMQPAIAANEKGSVILIVVVVLIAITAMGITLMNLGSSEQEMTANEQMYEQSFYNADSCVTVTAKFLRHLTDLDDRGYYGINEGDPIAPGIVYPDSVTAMGLHNKIMRSPDESFYTDDNGEEKFLFTEDIGFEERLLPAMADIRPQGETASPGTASNQQIAGYSAGIGLGGASSGGSNEWYIVACQGRGLSTVGGAARATGRAFGRYRKVAGMPGGL